MAGAWGRQAYLAVKHFKVRLDKHIELLNLACQGRTASLQPLSGLILASVQHTDLICLLLNVQAVQKTS